MKYLKSLLVASIAFIAAVALANPAAAVAAKFHSATGSVANNGALVVSFDERGLGNDNIEGFLGLDSISGDDGNDTIEQEAISALWGLRGGLREQVDLDVAVLGGNRGLGHVGSSWKGSIGWG